MTVRRADAVGYRRGLEVAGSSPATPFAGCSAARSACQQVARQRHLPAAYPSDSAPPGQGRALRGMSPWRRIRVAI